MRNGSQQSLCFDKLAWPGLINSKPFLVGGGNMWGADCCCNSSIWMSIIICHGWTDRRAKIRVFSPGGFSQIRTFKCAAASYTQANFWGFKVFWVKKVVVTWLNIQVAFLFSEKEPLNMEVVGKRKRGKEAWWKSSSSLTGNQEFSSETGLPPSSFLLLLVDKINDSEGREEEDEAGASGANWLPPPLGGFLKTKRQQFGLWRDF